MRASVAAEARAGQRVTIVGSLLNLVLVAGKLLAGWFGRSRALVADAVHSLSDLITDIVVVLGLRFGRKAPDSNHHFGHGRIETLAAAAVGLALLVAAFLIGYRAALDIYRGTMLQPTLLAVLGAAVSVGVKEALYWYTIRTARWIHSAAMMANAWHHRSDALSSLAVLVGVSLAQIRHGWRITDAIAALVVSLFIGRIGMRVIWEAMREMSDTAPSETVMQRIGSSVIRVAGVESKHALKVRSIGGLLMIQVHIVVAPSLSVADGHRIAEEVECCLRQDVADVGEVLVHVEPAESDRGEGSEEEQP